MSEAIAPSQRWRMLDTLTFAAMSEAIAPAQARICIEKTHARARSTLQHHGLRTGTSPFVRLDRQAPRLPLRQFELASSSVLRQLLRFS